MQIWLIENLKNFEQMAIGAIYADSAENIFYFLVT
jgi:hypothetical protein